MSASDGFSDLLPSRFTASLLPAPSLLRLDHWAGTQRVAGLPLLASEHTHEKGPMPEKGPVPGLMLHGSGLLESLHNLFN